MNLKLINSKSNCYVCGKDILFCEKIKTDNDDTKIHADCQSQQL
eukprot:gene7144-11457_t